MDAQGIRNAMELKAFKICVRYISYADRRKRLELIIV
jgi:hypothetical protein